MAHDETTTEATTDEFQQGIESARREVKIDAWTPWMARRYLDEVAARPLSSTKFDEFDRGYNHYMLCFADGSVS